jgi:sigma-B regulation protein RsbU (phosphoserine phosphatase)
LATGRPVDRSPTYSSLRHVLELGEDLLCIAQDASANQTEPGKTLVDQCSLVAHTAGRLIDGQVTVWLAEEVLHSFFGKAQKHFTDFTDKAGSIITKLPSPLILSCIETEQTRAAVNSCSDETWGVDEPRTQTEALAVASPMLVQDRVGQKISLLGVIQIERHQGIPFSIEEIDLLGGIAIQTALALQSSLHMASERWRREQFSLVREVSIQIVSLRDLDEIARRITDLILKTFEYYYVAIFTTETGQAELKFRASAGPAGKGEDEPSIYAKVDLGQGIIGYVAQSAKELLAPDVTAESRYRHLDLLPETRSEIALPLIVQDRLLGVLDVQSDQPDDFDEMDLLILRALAGNIAIAIEGARLYQDIHRRAVQLETIYEVSSAITSILNQEELLDEVVSLIQERFGYPFVHIFTVHSGRRKIFYEAGSGLHRVMIKKEDYTYELDDPLGLIPWVARNRETALVNDVRDEPRYRSTALPPDETLSELTVPLLFGGSILGVLDVQSDSIDAFGEEDRFLFEALADHIAIAMRNAYLYRSEVWRRGVADSLREVAGILSADVDLDQVLTAVLVELEHTLPLDAAAIWLLDETDVNEGSKEVPNLYLAAVRGVEIDGLDLEIGLKAEEVLEYNLDDPNREELQQAVTWLQQALESKTPVIRDPGPVFEPLGKILGFPDSYSAIATPLRIGERLLGALSLVHRTHGRYGSEARLMTAAFASYASVAIENTRLYEDAHEQAWVSTVLLQVATATQSIDNLPELLDTVIHITPMLAGVKACMLYILDEDGAFVPAVATGLTSDQQLEFERWRFAPGDVFALDTLLRERRPVILNRTEQDRRLSSILTAGTEEAEQDIGFPVLVPLLARAEVLGAFLVDYSAALPALNMGKSFEDFFDERLAILQGIAHQTAVAVDNIRLLKSQKEEAYVSVALLQVAQAVVSSSDLEEALGSIVRITPILVGIKRAAIYLWDESQSRFRLSQAYGLSHENLTAYSPGEFPFLQAVLEQDSVIAQPLSESVQDDEVPAAWSRLPVPHHEDVDRFLEEEACLLIAFPLSVKGKVLGVFVVEEPDPVPSETYGSGGANRRLRSKRMEIITGISQQASLAIQNDMLQRETVERERLAREMQLAREIQQAFLPQNVLELSGWDLQVYWRPAREVGGDFYDFFKLPGSRLGLVVADVADKGMPAALIMTLVRTLVRATVEVLDSPAEVVRRVNDLLVPDATRGMFVTLAYAVLDLETGEVTVANAGHNPPLVLHRTCRFERAKRGGMALGVIDRTEILEFRYAIAPGELLVMYTDGVTEAFSPEDEIFGEERLLEAIQEIAACSDEAEPLSHLSARDILEAIDRNVEQFIGDAPQSDDLTLVVLKRE